MPFGHPLLHVIPLGDIKKLRAGHADSIQLNLSPVLPEWSPAKGFLFLSFTQEIAMSATCPRCASTQLIPRQLGRQVGTTTGVVSGGTTGAVGALSGAKAGATVGLVAGPVGASIGTLAGALFGALVGGTAGGVAGARLGDELDAKVLDNIECRSCGHTFRLPLAEYPTYLPR